MIRNSIVGLVLLAVACGGTPRNAALKNRVSDERLAPISLQDRSQEAEAHQAVFLAEWQMAFTQGQLEGADLEVKIAKNDLASAKLGLKSASLEKAAADESGDNNKMKDSAQAALVAEREMEVHKIAIDRAKQSLSYLKKRLVYEEALFRSLEAKLEYSRAESLSAAGIVPPDFQLKTYKSQYADRQAQAKSYKAAVDAEEKELKSIDSQLAKAKSAAHAAQNPAASASDTTPVQLMPDLPTAAPVPMGTKAEPTPTEANPVTPDKTPVVTPPTATPPPVTPPAPKEQSPNTGSSPSKAPDAAPADEASANGDQP